MTRIQPIKVHDGLYIPDWGRLTFKQIGEIEELTGKDVETMDVKDIISNFEFIYSVNSRYEISL